MTDSLAVPHAGRARSVVVAAIQSVLAIAFVAAAGAMLANVPAIVQVFREIGLGQWLRYAAALAETAGVVILVVPGAAALGGLWLGATMVLAVLTNLFILHSNPVAALALLILCLAVVWLRRDELDVLRARFSSSMQRQRCARGA
jgi:putative oxidoreductase